MTESRKEALMKEARERAYAYEKRYHGCSQMVLLALQELLDLEDDLAFKAANSLVVGQAFTGNTCGVLSAGIMILGMKYGRSRAELEEGTAGVLKGILPAYRLVKWFEDEFGTTVCRDISGMKVGENGLKRMVARGPAVEEDINQERLEHCSQLTGKTAEKVVELIFEEDEAATSK